LALIDRDFREDLSVIGERAFDRDISGMTMSWRQDGGSLHPYPLLSGLHFFYSSVKPFSPFSKNNFRPCLTLPSSWGI
jgi:hypothetical protein